MYTEFKQISARNINVLKRMIREEMTRGYQPFDRILNISGDTVAIIMAKGSDATITDVEIIESHSYSGLVTKMNQYLAEGYDVFGEPVTDKYIYACMMTKGFQGSGLSGTGATGPQGPQGVRGERGSTGPQGPQGETGERGEAGARGEIGEQGPMGPVGPIGPQGPTGLTGPQGVAGPRGPAGPEGPEGPRGQRGEQGIAGPAGAIGLTFKGAWAPGIMYDKNDAVAYGGSTWFAVSGNTDETPGTGSDWQVIASSGSRGEKGDDGDRGPQGPEGAVGPIGPQGPKGDNGDVGARGPVGPQGAVGPQGLQGLAGPAGPQGIRGLTGAQGPAGDTGPQGLQGDTGPRGATGPQGPAGVDAENVYTYYNFVASTTARDMLIPGSPDTYLRATFNGTGGIRYTVVSSTGPARYFDWYINTPGAAAGENNTTLTNVSGTTTLNNGSVVNMGPAVGLNGFRKFEINMRDWNNKQVIVAEVWHLGRSGDSAMPVSIRISRVRTG